MAVRNFNKAYKERKIVLNESLSTEAVAYEMKLSEMTPLRLHW